MPSQAPSVIFFRKCHLPLGGRLYNITSPKVTYRAFRKKGISNRAKRDISNSSFVNEFRESEYIDSPKVTFNARRAIHESLLSIHDTMCQFMRLGNSSRAKRDILLRFLCKTCISAYRLEFAVFARRCLAALFEKGSRRDISAEYIIALFGNDPFHCLVDLIPALGRV